MKHQAGIGTALALLFSLPVFAGGKSDPAAGRAVFEKSCAMCHGPEGAGKQAIAKMFKVEMRPLGSKEVQAMSDAELKKIVVEGKGKMKPVKGLSKTNLDNLIAFLRTLKK